MIFIGGYDRRESGVIINEDPGEGCQRERRNLDWEEDAKTWYEKEDILVSVSANLELLKKINGSIYY